MNFNHQILSKRHKECKKTIPFEGKTINYWQVHSWANDLKLKMNGGRRTALLLNLLVLLYCDFALLLIQCGRWGRMTTVLSLLSEHERNLVQLKKRLSRWSWITHLRRPRNRKSIEFVSSRVHLNTMWIKMGSVNLPAYNLPLPGPNSQVPTNLDSLGLCGQQSKKVTIPFLDSATRFLHGWMEMRIPTSFSLVRSFVLQLLMPFRVLFQGYDTVQSRLYSSSYVCLGRWSYPLPLLILCK